MTIYTTGFTKKTAEEFFEPIRHHMIQLLVDVRLKNTSQLTRFSHGSDMKYLLERICGCGYEHFVSAAPSLEILVDWRRRRITWPEYEERYRNLITERGAVREFIMCYEGLYESVCLLCSEVKPTYCHRRLFAEMVAEELSGTEVIHI